MKKIYIYFKKNQEFIPKVCIFMKMTRKQGVLMETILQLEVEQVLPDSCQN